MTPSYNELYLDDAMENLGGMIAYAVTDCGYEPDIFFTWFISSGLADLFGDGNPRYVGGMSGIELAQQVVHAITGAYPQAQPSHQIGQAYWAGWILAYYQWVTGLSFRYITENGLPLSKILSLYHLHEADPSKFVEIATAIMDAHKTNHPS